MKKYFIINLALAGALSACLFTGCGKDGNSYCDEGIKCFNDSRFSEAEEYFEKAVKSDPDNADYLVYLVMAQIETLDYEGALNSFDSAISYDDECVDAYRGKGIIYFRQKDYNSSMEQMKKAMDVSQSHDEIYMDALKYYASCQYHLKDYEGAVSSYTKLISDAGKADKAELYYLRGTAYIKLKDENNAALDYESSLDIEDECFETYCNMYNNFVEAGYIDRGESYLKRLLDMDSEDKLLSGKAYYNLGEYEKAEDALLDAYNSGDKEAAYYLAMAYEALENYAEADSLYEEYLGKHPNDAGIYNQYGAYLIHCGKYDSALVYIETGLSMKNSECEQELLYNQAVCYEYLRDFEKAEELFASYLSKYPNDPNAMKEYEFLMSR